MQRLLILFVLAFASSTQAQMKVGMIYDLTTTREDIKQKCLKGCEPIEERDTIDFYSRFLGLHGAWTIIFDSTGRHRESDWHCESWFDTTALPTILAGLIDLYGKPATEGGYVKKATWHRGDTVIVLVHEYSIDQVSIHWRLASDPPLRWISWWQDRESRTDIETGRSIPPSIFELTVTRQDLLQRCEGCTWYATADTIILWDRIGGVHGRWTLIFDSHNGLRESNWASHEPEKRGPWHTPPPSKHFGREALVAVIRELSHLYGKPKVENGPITKVSWRQGEIVTTVTYQEQTKEIGVHYRFESDMPLKWIIPHDSPDTRIDVNTGLTLPK